MTRDIDAFWARFQSVCGLNAGIPPITHFGDTASQRDELCDLVLAGRKRATASLAIWYNEDEPLPAPGDLGIVVDGNGTPRCVIRISIVRLVPFNLVDEAFAATEGEGDGSLAYWTAEHRRFFNAELAKDGMTFSEDQDVVLEQFELLWPPPRHGR